jgi:hypothetical protein
MTDRERCLNALSLSNGNVEAALERLVARCMISSDLMAELGANAATDEIEALAKTRPSEF